MTSISVKETLLCFTLNEGVKYLHGGSEDVRGVALVEGRLLLGQPGAWHNAAGCHRPLVRLGVLIEHQAPLPPHCHYVLPLHHGLHTPCADGQTQACWA